MDGGFGLLIGALADVLITNIALFVDEEQRGPEARAVSGPCLPFIILGDWIRYVQANQRFFQVVEVAFVGKFGIVITNHYQALVFVLCVPPTEARDHPLAVNSAKGPHVDQNHTAAEVHQAQRVIGIKPDLVLQLGCWA